MQDKMVIKSRTTEKLLTQNGGENNNTQSEYA